MSERGFLMFIESVVLLYRITAHSIILIVNISIVIFVYILSIIRNWFSSSLSSSPTLTLL